LSLQRDFTEFAFSRSASGSEQEGEAMCNEVFALPSGADSPCMPARKSCKAGVLCCAVRREMDGDQQGVCPSCKSGDDRVGTCPAGVAEEGVSSSRPRALCPTGRAHTRPIAHGNSMVIGTTYPFCIISVGEGFVSMSGFEESELCGRKMLLLHGPKTDGEAIRTLVSLSQIQPYFSPASTSLVLYDRYGEEMVVHASFSRTPKDDLFRGATCCLIEIESQPDEETGDAHAGLIEDDDAQAQSCVVSPRWPHKIEGVSTGFLCFFGMIEKQVVGRNMSVVWGCGDAVVAKWESMLAFAAGGLMCEGRLTVEDSLCGEFEADVTLKPLWGDVLGWPEQVVTGVQVVFSNLLPREGVTDIDQLG